MNTPSRNVAAVRPSRLAPVLACIVTVLGLPVHAAVSLPDTPMQTNQGVPPNIWFILDDSGSMTFTAMPADRDSYGFIGSVPRLGDNVGDRSSVNNAIYYDPNTSYQAWQGASGAFLTGGTRFDSVFTHPAFLQSDDGIRDWANNFVGAGLPEDLRTQDQTFYVPTVATPGVNNNNYFRYRIIATSAPVNGGRIERCRWNGAAWTSACTFATPTGRSEADEKTNYATWFSYHRTRIKAAKAGASYAFNDSSVFNEDSQYRVGYTTIWEGGNTLPNQRFDIPVNIDNGLFRDTPTTNNRTVWFNRLFASGALNGTPLIPALTRAGAYFQNTSQAGPWGPQANGSQFECRQNFTILTTDGYWNTAGTTLGNVDNSNGQTITRPDAPSYQYTPQDPFRDNWNNTLADVAMYYWKTDLRTELQMINTVPSSASDPAFWQHMVTFGISIGLQGTLDVPATKLRVQSGLPVAWPNPQTTNLGYSGPERIDDLFHAAVNGHGSFVAASNPTEFAQGLGSALRAISARRGSGSNAAVAGTSTSAGTKVFQAKYFSTTWNGEVQAFPVSGTGIDTSNPLWTASIPVVGARSIYTFNGSAGTTFPTAAQNAALTPVVANYLRGDRSQEPQFNSTGLLRNRNTLLGDIVNSSPTYVKTSDTVDTVYVGANDGMLHAFNATNGVERFAYVPSGIDLAKLKEYSDPDYGHRFFVDGPIVTSTSRELTGRTVLVGSLGRGGRGLYALDITDPTIFGPSKVLWDKNSTFDSDMGLVLSKPIITKLNNGNTGVIVSNGLNSSSERAVLFVLDLVTGAKIAEIDTGVGSPVATNGLAAPRGWDEDGNGTVDFVYAGDFRGNLWKFDLSDSNPSQWGVADSRPLYAPISPGTQPITGGVTIAVDPATDNRWVFFGTGRLLTSSDITDTSRQTWYGVIDDAAATASVTRTSMTARNIALYDPVTKNRAFEPNSALPVNSKGWFIDLDIPPGNTLEGERMVGDPQIVKNALIAGSIIPSTSNPCLPGRGYINAIDAFTGTSLLTGLFDANRDNIFGNDTMGPGNTAIGSIDLGVGMVTDPALLDRLLVAGGSLASLASTPLDPALYGGRISWREIIRR